MPLPLDPQARLCVIDGKKYALLRRGPKNSRINEIDAENRSTVGESFLVRTSRIESIIPAESLWLDNGANQPQVRQSQTIRVDADVAAQLQTFASRHGESINDALIHLLRLAEDSKPSKEK